LSASAGVKRGSAAPSTAIIDPRGGRRGACLGQLKYLLRVSKRERERERERKKTSMFSYIITV